jgi:hypothetical protein
MDITMDSIPVPAVMSNMEDENNTMCEDYGYCEDDGWIDDNTTNPYSANMVTNKNR